MEEIEDGRPSQKNADVQQPSLTTTAPRKSGVSKKLSAAIVAIIVVSSVFFGVWYVYLRHWSIEEIAEQVIADPDLGSPGYKHSLAGKSVVVEGEVTNITTSMTTVGEMHYVELDGLAGMELLYWGTIDFDVGDNIEKEITFEWSWCNDERHVYSPELAFPAANPIFSINMVQYAIFSVATRGGTVEMVNQGNDVKTTIRWLAEPIVLNQVNCTLKAGSGSFTTEYMDVLGFFDGNEILDRVESLSESSGDSGIVEFTDVNNDSYLDNGDYFLLKNLSRPDTRSGLLTYMLNIYWPDSPHYDVLSNGSPKGSFYYQMTNEGVRFPTKFGSPTVRMFSSDEDGSRKFTFDSVSDELSWNNLTIVLDTGLGWEMLEPASENFTESSPSTLAFPARQIDDVGIELTCTDILGDGLVQKGDYFLVDAQRVEGAPDGYFLSVNLLYEPTDSNLAIEEELIENATPVTELETSLTGDLLTFTFSTIHNGTDRYYEQYSVPWDETTFALSDGKNSSSITPSSGFLHDGIGSARPLGTFVIGNLSVSCNATDLNGDGCLNNGDHITLEVAGGAGFSPAVTYSISVIYTPRASLMCEAEFTG